MTARLPPGTAKLFAPGKYVMLHPESQTPDAGRVGRIVNCKGDRMRVEFFDDDLIGKSDYSVIPRRHWAPVPEFMVEEYEPRAKKRGWRVMARHMDLVRKLGWQYTPATEGKT